MNAKKFSAALGNVRDEYVSEAIKYQNSRKRHNWYKWGAIAACLVFVVGIVIPLTQILNDKQPTEDISILPQLIEFNSAYYEVSDDKYKSVRKSLGIKENITEADAGEVITYLTRDSTSKYIATEEKTNIVLYSYAAIPCEAVYVICDNGNYNAVIFCNLVLPDTEVIALDRLYALYNIKNSSDISSISLVDDWYTKKIIGKTLTDENKISEFYTDSLVLKSYGNDDYHKMNYGHIATEEELLQAYEKTADNKITIMLETIDGLRFCLEYDAEGGWIDGNGTMRYYKVTQEITDWFSNNLSF